MCPTFLVVIGLYRSILSNSNFPSAQAALALASTAGCVKIETTVKLSWACLSTRAPETPPTTARSPPSTCASRRRRRLALAESSAPRARRLARAGTPSFCRFGRRARSAQAVQTCEYGSSRAAWRLLVRASRVRALLYRHLRFQPLIIVPDLLVVDDERGLVHRGVLERFRVDSCLQRFG